MIAFALHPFQMLLENTPVPCAGLGEYFYADHPTEYVRKICDDCPLQAECLDYALENGEEFGIWGGATAGQRRNMERPPGRRFRQCQRGHDLTPLNTHMYPSGRRFCVACLNSAAAA